MTPEGPIESGIPIPSNVTPSRYSFHAIGLVEPADGTVVEVLEFVGNIVRVRGFSAWPGTPILDLKPV